MRILVLIAALGLAACWEQAGSASSSAEAGCSGHQLLRARRAEGSCLGVTPQIIEAPDRSFRAVIYPAEVSLDATPDMESRVVIRSRAGDTLASIDHSSPRGSNGHYVYRGQWSPDGQYFAYSLVSSGGHSPWSWPIWVYGVKANRFAHLSGMIDGRPTLSGDFTFAAPHALTAMTWPQEGDIEHKVPVTVELDAAFARLPPGE